MTRSSFSTLNLTSNQPGPLSADMSFFTVVFFEFPFNHSLMMADITFLLALSDHMSSFLAWNTKETLKCCQSADHTYKHSSFFGKFHQIFVQFPSKFLIISLNNVTPTDFVTHVVPIVYKEKPLFIHEHFCFVLFHFHSSSSYFVCAGPLIL